MSATQQSSVQRNPVPASHMAAAAHHEPVSHDNFVTMLERSGFRAEGFDSAEALMASDWADNTACLLLESGRPGSSGRDLLERLGNSGHRVPVVMVTGTETAVRALHEDASDLRENSARDSGMIVAIKRVISQNKAADELSALQRGAARLSAQLTARQHEILQLIVDGQPNKIIAADLGISQRTVENHRAEIMRKAGTRSLPALARMVFAASL